MATTSLTNTNISDTYTGVLHAKGEPIPASGLQDVYDGFGNKSALKIGRAGQGIDIDGSLGASFINALYPVGAVIFSADNTNPGVRFSGTTWTQVAEGRFIAGVGTGSDASSASGTITAGADTVGEYKHTLIEAELPIHDHDLPISNNNGLDGDYLGQGASYNGERVALEDLKSATAGSNTPHNNIPPAFGLYVWKRITTPA